jgi:hypothetical protein
MTDGRSQDGVTDHEEQKALIRFCTDPAVAAMRLHFLVDPNKVDTGSLATFMRQATDAGIDVFAVPRGSIQDEWIQPLRTKQPANHQVVLDWISWIHRFNAGHPEAGFAGINLDIEPHRASPVGGKPLWKKKREGLSDSKTNRRIALEYLDLLDLAILDKRALSLAVTIPAWYDGNSKPKPFRLSAGGKRQSWASHIQDRVDFVSLMAYTDASEDNGKDRLVRHVAGEIEYGPTEVLMETSRQGRSGKAHTLYEEGEKTLLKLERQLAKKFGKQPNYLGTGVHHYLDAYGSGRRKWPEHGGSRPE